MDGADTPPPDGQDSAPGDGPPWADEAVARNRSDRKAAMLVAAVPLAVAAMALLSGPGALFLTVAVVQVGVLAWRARRRAPQALGEIRCNPTAVGRVWIPVAWALLLATVFVPGVGARLVAATWLACSLAAWPLARAGVRHVGAQRATPSRARAFAPVLFEYRVRADGRRGARDVVVRDVLGFAARPASLDVVVPAVPRGGEAVGAATVTFERRGLRRLRPLVVATRAPLGLFEASFETRAPGEILVRPAEGRATAALLQRLTGPVTEASRAVAASEGADEPWGLREWRQGDDPRRIHWRTTARRGQATTLERRAEGGRHAVVVLDRRAGRGAPADRRFERAVSVAATVLRTAVRAGRPASLWLADGDPADGAPLRGRAGLERALDRLAFVRATGSSRGAPPSLPPSAVGATVVWVDAGGDDLDPPAAALARGALRLRADDPALGRFVEGLA